MLSSIRNLALVALTPLCAFAANPTDFGMAEFQSALAARNLKIKVLTEINLEAPESFRIEPYAAGGARIAGGDLRGVMYGLLAAADQVRETGKLKSAKGDPAIAQRGMRITLSDLSAQWVKSPDTWRGLFQKMARQWMNRLAIDLPQGVRPQDYPQIVAITKAANEYGVDIILSPAKLIGSVDQVHDDYASLVRQSPLVRAVELDANLLAVPGYDTAVLAALHESGRRIALEIRDVASHPELLALAESQGVPVRATARLRCDTPQPSPSCTGVSIANNPRTHDFVWEVGTEAWVSEAGIVHNFLPILDGGFDVALPSSPSGEPALVDPLAATWGRTSYVAPKPPAE